jgi:acetyltransferase-like isoleucine patch superfamily enzyme
MKIGKYSYIVNKDQANILFRDSNCELHIGNFCSIGTDLTVFLGGNHRVDWTTTYPFGHINQKVFDKFDGKGHPCSKGDVVIGNDVWIGSHVTIMSGVIIGDGAVVGTRSVVAKNVPPYAIVAGNPAKIIKMRFPENIIKELLNIKWWNWEDELINEMSPLLCSDDISKFIETANKIISEKNIKS